MAPSLGHITEIWVAPARMAAMLSTRSVHAIPGRGLKGDRYFEGTGTFSPQPQKPDFELTLIEEEAVTAFARESGLSFSSADARRNIVTRGVRLNDLIGRDFSVGAVRVRGIRLCEPCAHLAKLTHPGVLVGLVHKGGLRAQILSEGTISLGDIIQEFPTGLT